MNPQLLPKKSDYEETEFEAINKGICEPIYDLLDRGGKRWRPVLGMVFAECYGRDVAKSIQLDANDKSNDDILFSCGLTEIVHNGSLMVDDIEDKSLLRRGQPCTYLKYGDDYAINTGNFMYYIPISRIQNFI